MNDLHKKYDIKVSLLCKYMYLNIVPLRLDIIAPALWRITKDERMILIMS